MNTLQEKWESYQKMVLPKNASAIQIQECRRAFYAGAVAMIDIVTKVGEPDVSEDAGVALIASYHNELASFYDRIGIDV